MQPLEDVSTMAALDFASRFSNSDRALPLHLQAVLLFLQECIGQHSQGTTSAGWRWRSSPDSGPGRVPLCYRAIWTSISQRAEIWASRVWTLASRSLETQARACASGAGSRVTHDHDLAALELADRGGEHMHIHHLATSRPLQWHIVLLAQPSHIVAELRPSPAARGCLVGQTQPTIALPASGDETATLARRTPQAFGAVPASEQHMRYGPLHWLKITDERVVYSKSWRVSPR